MRQLAQIRKSNKEIVGIIVAPDNVNNDEYSITKDIVEAAGYNTETICVRQETYTEDKKKKINVDKEVKDANYKDYSALVVVGGEDSLS